MAMKLARLRMNFAGIADAAAAVFDSIGIDALAIPSPMGHADPVILARHRGKIAHDDSKLMRAAAAAQIGNDALFRIGDVDPLKSVGIAIEAMQCGGAAVEMVQIAH